MINTFVKALFGSTDSSDLSEIERFAIYPSVSLGSLYDAAKDSIVQKLNLPINPNVKNVKKKPTCKMLPIHTIKQEALLKMIDIDNETRLSLALKLIESNGILSLIKYSLPINRFTRLIHYFHQSRNESLNDDILYRLPIPKCTATHVITKIKWGIGVVIILQLDTLNQSSISKIDDVLTRLCSEMEEHSDICHITPEYERVLESIPSTKIYSNMNELSSIGDICALFRQIQMIKSHSHLHSPLTFKIKPINSFPVHPNSNNNIYIPINEQYTIDIETYLLPLSFQIEPLEKRFDEELVPLLNNHLPKQLNNANQKLVDFKNHYLTAVKLIGDSIIQIRRGQPLHQALYELHNSNEYKSLNVELKDVIFYFDNLKSKKNLIRYLHEKQIDYLDVNNINVDQNDTQQILKVKLFQKYQNASIFCSNDYLWHEKRDQHDSLLSQFEKQRMENHKSNYVYADFSYSAYDLKDFAILNSEENQNTNASPIPEVKIPLKTESTINILLFGESGVGKSTFINAFANYLLYEDIDQARSKEPVVIIPVSFTMTIDDQFTEKIIKFGQQDPNENHNNTGQSVTQQCKSYEFKTRDGKTLKIIDTPGFDDSRGQNQDEKNLNEIFSFIQNLPHLNALCILLKPNVKELNPSFRTSFIQLLRHLGDQFFNNIFFCFTNSQSTFFTVGDTGPVLKRFLQTSRLNQIQMDKENTFCFDSESFRYLVASQHSIEFDQQFIQQFEQSWAKSVKESNRLVDQISVHEKQMNINPKWISIKQIKQQISHLIRPLLEAMRNISRNNLLTDTEFSKRSILLIPSSIHSSKFICYKSNRPYKTFGPFNIMNEYIHESSDQCQNEHLTTNYRLDYELGDKTAQYSSEDANAHLSEIIKACAHFDYFLKDDYQHGLFLTGINRMINEEKVMSEQVQSNNLNEKLSRRLHGCREQYTKDFDGINFTNEYLHLKSIYSRIDGIKQMPMIYEQLNPT